MGIFKVSNYEGEERYNVSYRESDSREVRSSLGGDPQSPHRGKGPVGWKVKVKPVLWFDDPTDPIDARPAGRMMAGCLFSSLLLFPCPVGVSSERSEQIFANMTGRT
jgi:hypothetical protein